MQLQDNMKMAQSCPPEAVEARTLIMAQVVKLSEIPNGSEVAQHMLEKAGLAPPSTPEAKQQLDQQNQEAQQNKQLQLEDAMAQIGHRRAQSEKLLADADLKKAMANTHLAGVSNPQFEQANQQLLLERTAAQNARTRAQTDKINQELETQAPIQLPPPQIPEHW